MPADKDASERSTVNRLTTLIAGQEQSAKEIEQIRGQIKALLIMQAYLLGIGVLCWLALRQGARQ
jgi:hypothetical protein